jgi:hypothetical protein
VCVEKDRAAVGSKLRRKEQRKAERRKAQTYRYLETYSGLEYKDRVVLLCAALVVKQRTEQMKQRQRESVK